jgi:hypothetical protein
VATAGDAAENHCPTPRRKIGVETKQTTPNRSKTMGMGRVLHTRVTDDIRAACTHNGELDTVQQSEMRMESPEYAAEVRGHYDYDYDPADMDDDGPDLEPEEEHCLCGAILIDGECSDSRCATNDHDDGLTDVEADADTLRSAGMGTDEDYGNFGGHEDFGWDGGREE